MKKTSSSPLVTNNRKSNFEETLSESDESSSSYSSNEKDTFLRSKCKTKDANSHKLKTNFEKNNKNTNIIHDINDMKNNELRTAKRIIEGLRPIKSSNESINISSKSSKDFSDSNIRDKEINNSRLRIRKLSSSFSSASSNSFTPKKKLINSKKKIVQNPNNEKLNSRYNRLKIKYSDDEFEFDDDFNENSNNNDANLSLNNTNRTVNKAGVNIKKTVSNKQQTNKSNPTTYNRNDKISNIKENNKKIKLKLKNSDDSSEDNFLESLTKKKIIECDEKNDIFIPINDVKTTNSKKNDNSHPTENVETYISNIKDEEQNDSCSEGNNTNSTFITACEDVFITDVTSGVVTVTIKESSTPDGFFKKRNQE
jgi:hypothetical protein